MSNIRDYDFWPVVDGPDRNGLNVYIGWDINDALHWAIASIRDLKPNDITVGMKVAQFMQWVDLKTPYQVSADNSLKRDMTYITVRLKDIELYPDTFEEMKTRLYHLNWAV